MPHSGFGCFEIDNETKHFGIVKGKSIEGLGLRIHKRMIETGKFRNGVLEGQGRRLEFGKSLYEGEFLQGKYYGKGRFALLERLNINKGTLYQWEDKKKITGVFTLGMLMNKIQEQTFSLGDLGILFI